MVTKVPALIELLEVLLCQLEELTKEQRRELEALIGENRPPHRSALIMETTQTSAFFLRLYIPPIGDTR